MNPTQAAAGVGDDLDTSLSQLDRLTVNELSEVLDRRTRETQRLQEEVEDATNLALEKLACTYEVDPDPYGHVLPNHRRCSDGFSVYSRMVSPCQRPVVQLLDCGHERTNQSDVITPGEETKQEDLSFDKAIMNLQTKLQKVQMEKDSLSELRVMDSRRHVDQMEKMLHMLEELQNIKRSADWKLRETESESLALNKKIETLEGSIKDVYHTLLDYKRKCSCNTVTNPETATLRRPSPPGKITDINEDMDKLQQIFLSPEYVGSMENTGDAEPKERMQQLISSLDQEMATLADKLSSSNDCSIGLSVKLDLLKKVAERQASVHQHQVHHLEQQLLQAQAKLAAALKANERSSQQAEELQSRLHQAERCSERLQHELREEAKTLRGQLQAAGEQLRKGAEEKTCLQASLEQEAQEMRRSLDEELQRVRQEAEQHVARLEEARSQCQGLLEERDLLKLRLDDGEKAVALLGLQAESSERRAAQQSHAVDGLRRENGLLGDQLHQCEQEIQQLRAELDQRESDLAAAEHERRRLHTSVMEQTRRTHEETLEKQQLAARLEAQRVQLHDLAEEHKELQRLHSCQNKEREGAALKLQSQLKLTQAELERVTSTLRTLEGADGHGLRVAMGMQKEITARREQADSLQGRIQHLEETLEKLQRERGYQNLENQHHVQELAFVREEKKQLGDELEALRSRDKQLRDRIGKLEAILHKMSESFADCQDFLQLQEQKFFRLKLKHALDLQELQGQKVCAAPTATPPVPHSATPRALADPPSSRRAPDTRIKCNGRPESPTRELRCLVEELRGAISQNRRPHTDNRRRSAPERPLSTDEAQAVNPGGQSRRKTCGSEPHFLRTPEWSAEIMCSTPIPKSHVLSSPATPARPTFPPPRLSPGRRSPVHSLLTSDPNS